jgi:hypothetical protein
MATDSHEPKSLGIELPVSTMARGFETSRDQLALIGAAFVAGIRCGSGNLETARTVGEPESEAAWCIHKIPSIPLLLDGRPAAPEAVKDFDGKPLDYILDELARDGESLRVFSDQDEAEQYLAGKSEGEQASGSPRVAYARINSINTGSSPQEIADVIGGSVFLYEHVNYRGSRWGFNAGSTSNPGSDPGHFPGHGNIPDFRRVFCFLGLCQNINDKVSSVWNASEVWAYVRPRRGYAILHEHINFQGSRLWILQRAFYPDLTRYGWNDIASSMSYALI